MELWLFALAGALFALIAVARSVVFVPNRTAYVVERLGRYSTTLDAGLHLLVPFIDVVRQRHSLGEIALDVGPQTCMTRDNVPVTVSGVCYVKVLRPDRASYGITDYRLAVTEVVQRVLRSEAGSIEFDRVREQRSTIAAAVITALDRITEPWGVKALRTEITISPASGPGDANQGARQKPLEGVRR